MNMQTRVNANERMIETKLYTSREVAAMLQCSERSIHNFVKEKLIRPLRIGRLVRFSKESIEDFLNQCSQQRE